MKKLVVITLVGALLVPTLYAAKPLKIQDNKSAMVLQKVEELAYDLSDADKATLARNLQAKFKGKLGLGRYPDNATLANKIFHIISVRYENLKDKHLKRTDFENEILNILNPAMPLNTPAKKLRRKPRMGSGPVMTQPSKPLRPVRTHPVGPETGMYPVKPANGKVHMGPGPVRTEPTKIVRPRTTEGTRYPVRGPRGGTTRAITH